MNDSLNEMQSAKEIKVETGKALAHIQPCSWRESSETILDLSNSQGNKLQQNSKNVSYHSVLPQLHTPKSRPEKMSTKSTPNHSFINCRDHKAPTGILIGSGKRFDAEDSNLKDPLKKLIQKAQHELTQYDTDYIENDLMCTVREIQAQKVDPDQMEAISNELEKWKEFGYLMAESYEKLKVNYNSDKEKQKEIILALKDQILKLKELLKHAQKENNDLKEQQFSENSIQKLKQENNSLKHRLKALEQELEVHFEEKNLSEQLIQQLNEQIKKLKKTAGKSHSLLRKNNKENSVLYYKKISQSHLEECSSLAEELICLRNDLDKSHSENLRARRQHSVSTDNFSILSNSSPQISKIRTDRSIDSASKPFSVHPQSSSCGSKNGIERASNKIEIKRVDRKPPLSIHKRSYVASIIYSIFSLFFYLHFNNNIIYYYVHYIYDIHNNIYFLIFNKRILNFTKLTL